MYTKKNIEFARKRFEKGANFYGNKQIAPQTAQLRVAVKLVTGQGSYKFDVTKDESVKHVIEQLLKRNDLFVTRAIGIALMMDKNDAPGQAPLMSYPLIDSLALPTGIKGFTNANAHAIYNGVLGMKTGSQVNYSRFPCAPFLHVPSTQPVAIWNGAALISSGVQPEFNLENILFELPEELVFAGTKSQPVTLDFPIKPDATLEGPAGYTPYVVLIVDGWIYEGGTTPECDVQGNPYKGLF